MVKAYVLIVTAPDATHRVATQVRAIRHVAEVREVLKRHGSEVLEVDHPTNTLEDLFVKTVRESAARPGQRYIPPTN